MLGNLVRPTQPCQSRFGGHSRLYVALYLSEQHDALKALGQSYPWIKDEDTFDDLWMLMQADKKNVEGQCALYCLKISVILPSIAPFPRINSVLLSNT